jgi:fructose-1,6-bisphosphatase/inositol monophosphatase family enzyme
MQSCFALEGALIAAGQLDGFIDFSAKARHKVCDIAAAKVIVEESGAQVYDRGTAAPLTDFELTRLLNRKFNIVAAATHDLGGALCRMT